MNPDESPFIVGLLESRYVVAVVEGSTILVLRSFNREDDAHALRKALETAWYATCYADPR